ncbi:MAG: NAD(P)/FAD-dependent oxidoreductase [Pseudomonadota bacterium]
MDNGSFWFDSLEQVTTSRANALPTDVDVAIIGAGYTGLWTAFYLHKASPELSIAVFEANAIGFGASGRNGGWCMGTAMGIDQLLAQPSTQSAGLQLAQAMQATVDEIGEVCRTEGINCDFHKGGTLTVATSAFQAENLQAAVEAAPSLGFRPDDFQWLSPAEARQRINTAQNHGAIFTPHCAAIHPARLVHGLADKLLGQGVQILEQTPVLAYQPGQLETARGKVRARIILRATEGYTPTLRGHARSLLPLYSMMIATEPLAPALWEEIGLGDRETFGDTRRIVIYGQRTADNRLAFGGRAGYYFGSRIRSVIDPADPHFAKVESALKTLLPQLEQVKITHRWGGCMGVPRHWRPFVTFDARTGLGAAGGYTGEGVAATNLAARILTRLVRGEVHPLTGLAWIDDVPPNWEPEPLRYLGVSAIEFFGDRADSAEFASGRPSRFWGGLFSKFVG